MSRRSSRIAISACLTMTLIVGGCSSDPAPPVQHPVAYRPPSSPVRYTDVRPEDLIADDFVVRPGDVLELRVTDIVGPGVETVQRYRVGESGTISLPLVGFVRVAGLTEREVNQVVNEALSQCGSGNR